MSTRSDRSRSLESALALAQGTYYSVTGVWPFVSMPAFEAVTGEKKEWWLVKTVGALVGVVGGALLVAARRGEVSPDLKGVAIGSAVALGGVSAYYAAKGRISPVYYLDALAEAGLIAGWWFASRARREDMPLDGGRGDGALIAERDPAVHGEHRTALP